MTWDRRDDKQWRNPKVAQLSDAAYRLRDRAINYCCDTGNGGFLTPGDLATLGVTIAKGDIPGQCADPRMTELTAAPIGFDQPFLVLVGDGPVWEIHDFSVTNSATVTVSVTPERAKPVTAASLRARRYRLRKRHAEANGPEYEIDEPRHAPVTPTVTQPNASSRARAADARIPDTRNPVNSLFPTVRESADNPVEIIEASDPVGAFIDACKALGLTAPDGRTKGRVGAEAKRLIADGKPVDLVLEGCKELARRNASPAHLAYIIGDIERHQKGIDTSRRQPTQNPVSREIQSFTAFSDAEERGERL